MLSFWGRLSVSKSNITNDCINALLQHILAKYYFVTLFFASLFWRAPDIKSCAPSLSEDQFISLRICAVSSNIGRSALWRVTFVELKLRKCERFSLPFGSNGAYVCALCMPRNKDCLACYTDTSYPFGSNRLPLPYENKSPVFVRGLSGFSPEDIFLPGFVWACPDFT